MQLRINDSAVNALLAARSGWPLAKFRPNLRHLPQRIDLLPPNQGRHKQNTDT